MAPKFPRAFNKPHLSKNKSVKLFKGKQKKREEYARRRKELIEQYEQLDTLKISKFEELPLTFETQKGLKKCDYSIPTEIQVETIGLALKGHDILGAAKTGSGKTLAFIVPVLERLFREGWCKSDGLGVLVITPTRELAMQIYEVTKNVGSFHDFTIGLVIGGKDLREERKILNVYNIVICTPGRLLQHMDENPLFDAMNLQMLVLDEADRILDLGFEKDMNAILENLPENRQTLLFSATQTKSVKDLARLSLKNPMYVSVHEHAKHATPESLQQSFIECELSKKMDFLWSFIKSHRKQKVLIFMASCKQVKYTFDVFCRMKPGVSLTALYGDLHQLKRMERYKDFCRKNHVVMFATDLAARGLDFPNVNWVVQLDCPEDTNTYIHRAGRTARYEKGGESLLVLLPTERESMISQLGKRKVPISEIKVHPNKIVCIQRKVEALCARDVTLKESAQRAFKSYYKSVFLMKDKTVFDINCLNDKEVREAYARSLGLALAPRIRFIEKRLKNKVESEKRAFDCSSEEEDDDDDEFLKPKVTDNIVRNYETVEKADNSDSDAEEQEASNTKLSSKKGKPLTKAAVAKKILKKNFKANTKVVFNDEGEIVEDTPRTLKADIANKIAKEMAEEGYNIEKAKQIMDEEDAVDKMLYREKVKQKHKERRLKLKKQRQQEQGENVCELGGHESEKEAEKESGSEIDTNHLSSDSESEEAGNVQSDNDSDSSSSNKAINRKRKYSEDDMQPQEKTHKVKKLSSYLEDEESLALHFLSNS